MGILSDVDNTLNEVDAWLLKQEFDAYKKFSLEAIQKMNSQITRMQNDIANLEAFSKYLEYTIAGLDANLIPDNKE